MTEFGIVGYSSVILVQEGDMYLLYDCGPKGCALQLKDALKTQGLQPEESAEVTKVEAMNRILAREAAEEGGDEFNQEYNEGIYVGYRYFDTFGVKVRFPFGFGFSYTSFAVSGKAICVEDGKIVAKVTVTNTGSYSGKEVIQLYATVPFGPDGAEAKRLIEFEKTELFL